MYSIRAQHDGVNYWHGAGDEMVAGDPDGVTVPAGAETFESTTAALREVDRLNGMERGHAWFCVESGRLSPTFRSEFGA